MSRFFKSAAFPILIVVVLAFFAQKLIGSSSHGQRPTFGTLLTDIRGHEDKSMSIHTKGNTVDENGLVDLVIVDQLDGLRRLDLVEPVRVEQLGADDQHDDGQEYPDHRPTSQSLDVHWLGQVPRPSS